MKALCWHGNEDIRCESVDDPKILDPHDAIIKVTSCAICGSDLHLMGGFVPSMKSGDIMGMKRWAKSSKSARQTGSSGSVTASSSPSRSAAASAGRAGIFAEYRLRIAGVSRDYWMNARSEAPLDSLAAHEPDLTVSESDCGPIVVPIYQ